MLAGECCAELDCCCDCGYEGDGDDGLRLFEEYLEVRGELGSDELAEVVVIVGLGAGERRAWVRYGCWSVSLLAGAGSCCRC